MASPSPGSGILSVTKAEEEVLAHEVLFQVWCAQLAWANLPEALKLPAELERLRGTQGSERGPAEGNPLLLAFIQWNARIWITVHAILSAAAVVSRTLWPFTHKRPKGLAELLRANRADELRVRWGIPPSSVLTDRDVRDVFEHVDEKLIKWLDEYTPAKMMGLAIREVPPTGPTDQAETFRVLDPKTLVVWAGGKRADLKAIVDALEAVAAKLPQLTHIIDIGFPVKNELK